MTAHALLLLMVASTPTSTTAPARVDLDHGFYLVSRPTGIPDDAPLPLMICLHGTETTAADILDFWRGLDHQLPYVMVAPQGTYAGWRDTDRALVDEFLEHVSKTVAYDRSRVLLTGHSAGGAMAFHLLYVEGFPASAVAVTANYVPPTVEPRHVARHKDVPIFYAVGEGDVNRERMREGLTLLRRNGARVTVRRPRIGHVLDPSVGQAAIEWYESLCRERVDAILARAQEDLDAGHAPGPSAAALEALVRHATTHHADQVSAATATLFRLQEQGRLTLARADMLLELDRPLAARDELLTVEDRYGGSSLALEARRRRERIEAIPEVADLLRLERRIGVPPTLPPAGHKG